MQDDKEPKTEDLTEMLQDGVLTNPSDKALFKGDDLKAGDITVTIRGAKKRKFLDSDETAWILFFEEVDSGLKLNKTRTEQLFTLMGTNNIGEMVGRPITLTYDPNIVMSGRKVGGVALKRAEETLV